MQILLSGKKKNSRIEKLTSNPAIGGLK